MMGDSHPSLCALLQKCLLFLLFFPLIFIFTGWTVYHQTSERVTYKSSSKPRTRFLSGPVSLSICLYLFFSISLRSFTSSLYFTFLFSLKQVFFLSYLIKWIYFLTLLTAPALNIHHLFCVPTSCPLPHSSQSLCFVGWMSPIQMLCALLLALTSRPHKHTVYGVQLVFPKHGPEVRSGPRLCACVYKCVGVCVCVWDRQSLCTLFNVCFHPQFILTVWCLTS